MVFRRPPLDPGFDPGGNLLVSGSRAIPEGGGAVVTCPAAPVNPVRPDVNAGGGGSSPGRKPTAPNALDNFPLGVTGTPLGNSDSFIGLKVPIDTTGLNGEDGAPPGARRPEFIPGGR